LAAFVLAKDPRHSQVVLPNPFVQKPQARICERNRASRFGVVSRQLGRAIGPGTRALDRFSAV
jgi:hypothetical protein